ARALALCARLDLDHAAGDSTLSDRERNETFASAEAYAYESIARFQRAGMIAPQLESKWVLGRIAEARQASSAARRMFQDCLSLARQVDNDVHQEHALDGLVRVAEKAGDLDEVARLLDQWASIRSPTDSWPLARAQSRLLFEHDQADLAAEFLQRCKP